MKININFEVDSFEESEDLNYLINARDYAFLLEEVDSRCRNILKHLSEGINPEVMRILEEIREDITEVMR